MLKLLTVEMHSKRTDVPLSFPAGLIGKSKGKLMTLSMLLHVISEAEKAIARDAEPGTRFSNIVRKESLDMAIRLYELFDQQRLLLMGEREILHLVWPDIFDDPNPNAPLARISAGRDAPSMVRTGCFFVSVCTA